MAQIEIGALLVGGIVNDHENVMMRKGAEMGHFELIGSTIVLLFKKGHIDLLPEIKECIKGDKEVRVSRDSISQTGQLLTEYFQNTVVFRCFLQ